MKLIKLLNSFLRGWQFCFALFFCFVFCQTKSVYCQQICGIVLDEKNREPLIGATVFQAANAKGTFTDNNGYFCLQSTPLDSIKLQVSYIGYQTQNISILKHSSDSLLVILLTSGVSMDEITVVEKSKTNRSTGLYEFNGGSRFIEKPAIDARSKNGRRRFFCFLCARRYARPKPDTN